jgi:hypothetical protein
MGMDVKECHDPVTKKKQKWLVMVDEADRLAVAKMLFDFPADGHRNVTAREAYEGYLEAWGSVFGHPETIRHDAEGILLSHELLGLFSELGVRLDSIPGEAHEQLGITERTMGTVWRSVEAFISEGVGAKEAVYRVLAAHNTVERVAGYCPAQWAFGRLPTWGGHLFGDDEDEVDIAKATGSFREGLERQARAHDLYLKSALETRMAKIRRMRNRRQHVYKPGELVCAWRRGKGAKRRPGMMGKWHGPGEVLGTRTKIQEGQRLPAAQVFIIMNGKIWCCSPSQLRPASKREQAQYDLERGCPWTFESMLSGLSPGEVVDVQAEGDPPEDEEDHPAVPPRAGGRRQRQPEAKEPPQEAPPPDAQPAEAEANEPEGGDPTEDRSTPAADGVHRGEQKLQEDISPEAPRPPAGKQDKRSAEAAEASR